MKKYFKYIYLLGAIVLLSFASICVLMILMGFYEFIIGAVVLMALAVYLVERFITINKRTLNT